MPVNPGTELAALDFGNLIGGPLNAVITAQAMAAQSTASFIKDVGFYQKGQVDAEGNDIGNTPIYVDFKYPKEILPYQPGKTYLKVVSIVILDGGSGYVAAPLVTFSAAGTGEILATGTATVTAIVAGAGGAPATGGSIDTITISVAGSYLTPPTITIAPPPAGGTPPQVTVNTGVDHITNSVAAVYQDMKFSVPILTMLPIPFIKVDIITIDFNAKITSMETQSESSDLSVGVALEVKQRWPGGSAKLNVSVAYKKSTSSGASVERTYSMAIHVQASQDEMPAGMEKLLGILEGAMIATPGAIVA